MYSILFNKALVILVFILESDLVSDLILHNLKSWILFYWSSIWVMTTSLLSFWFSRQIKANNFSFNICQFFLYVVTFTASIWSKICWTPFWQVWLDSLLKHFYFLKFKIKDNTDNRDRAVFFVRFGHETTYASIGNHHFWPRNSIQ